MKEFKNVFLNQLLTRFKTVALPGRHPLVGDGNHPAAPQDGYFSPTLSGSDNCRCLIVLRHHRMVYGPSSACPICAEPLVSR
jgi:hypothetical protein